MSTLRFSLALLGSVNALDEFPVLPFEPSWVHHGAIPEVGDAEFAKLVSDAKQEKVEAISNLTCVAKEMKLWKEDNSINIDYITTDMIKDVSLTVTEKPNICLH